MCFIILIIISLKNYQKDENLVNLILKIQGVAVFLFGLVYIK